MVTSPVLVFGSLNLDLILRVPHLPRGGETMHSLGLERQAGGKGANQAAACVALGVETALIGAVGNDEAGELMRSALKERGVDIAAVRTAQGVATGQAYIHVAGDGENTITLHGGANQQVGGAELQALDTLLAGAKVLLLQLEIPLAANIEAAKRARAAGVTVMLDPAPATGQLPPELLAHVDILTPNEHEAQTLTAEADPEKAAHKLLTPGANKLGSSQVVLKLGRRGALLLGDGHGQHFAAPDVRVVSTVAAGDTFNGALAAALAHGKPIAQATAFAVQAASLRVGRAAGYQHLPGQQDLQSPHV